MNKVLVIISIVFSSFGINAHEYFFGFAEVQYNDMSQKFEATLIFTSHDLEQCLGNVSLVDDDLSDKELLKLKDYINKTFRVKSGDQLSQWTIIGTESFTTGTTNIYIESQPIKDPNELKFTFSSLMEEFDNQQNKITLLYRDQTKTMTFMKNNKSESIKLESI